MNAIEYVVDRVSREGVNPEIVFLFFLIAVIIACALWRFRLARKIRKQIAECDTYAEAGRIAARADGYGFPSLYAKATEKEQSLFTEFLKNRETQFRNDLAKAVGSEEELHALLGYDRYGVGGDSSFTALVENEVRKALRPFTEKRIHEATTLKDLMYLGGDRWYLQMFLWGGFDRVDEALAGVFNQKIKQLACREAITSTFVNDTCFAMKTGDKFVDALIAIKREIITLSSLNAPFELDGLCEGINSALEKACK